MRQIHSQTSIILKQNVFSDPVQSNMPHMASHSSSNSHYSSGPFFQQNYQPQPPNSCESSPDSPSTPDSYPIPTRPPSVHSNLSRFKECRMETLSSQQEWDFLESIELIQTITIVRTIRFPLLVHPNTTLSATLSTLSLKISERVLTGCKLHLKNITNLSLRVVCEKT